jgi:hypothetical protein
MAPNFENRHRLRKYGEPSNMTEQPCRTGMRLAGAGLLLGFSVLTWGCGARQPQKQGVDASPTTVQVKDPKPQWKPLFDGKSLANWESANFGGEGEVSVKDGAIVMETGNDMTGVTYTKGDFPKIGYEVVLEGKKLKGSDFFCTTTFPVGEDHCSLVVGGWAGSVVGLSSIDGRDANENETNSLQEFKRDQWYHVRIRVAKDKIEAWIDDKKVIDLATGGKKITIRGECEPCKPFGIATWRTSGAVRDIRVRSLNEDDKNR